MTRYVPPAPVEADCVRNPVMYRSEVSLSPVHSKSADTAAGVDHERPIRSAHGSTSPPPPPHAASRSDIARTKDACFMMLSFAGLPEWPPDLAATLGFGAAEFVAALHRASVPYARSTREISARWAIAHVPPWRTQATKSPGERSLSAE